MPPKTHIVMRMTAVLLGCMVFDVAAQVHYPVTGSYSATSPETLLHHAASAGTFRLKGGQVGNRRMSSTPMDFAQGMENLGGHDITGLNSFTAADDIFAPSGLTAVVSELTTGWAMFEYGMAPGGIGLQGTRIRDVINSTSSSSRHVFYQYVEWDAGGIIEESFGASAVDLGTSVNTDIDSIAYAKKPTYPCYFTVDAVTAGQLSIDLGLMVTTADVLRVDSKTSTPSIHRRHGELGLQPGHVIDALVMNADGVLLFSLTAISESIFGGPNGMATSLSGGYIYGFIPCDAPYEGPQPVDVTFLWALPEEIGADVADDVNCARATDPRTTPGWVGSVASFPNLSNGPGVFNSAPGGAADQAESYVSLTVNGEWGGLPRRVQVDPGTPLEFELSDINQGNYDYYLLLTFGRPRRSGETTLTGFGTLNIPVAFVAGASILSGSRQGPLMPLGLTSSAPITLSRPGIMSDLTFTLQGYALQTAPGQRWQDVAWWSTNAVTVENKARAIAGVPWTDADADAGAGADDGRRTDQLRELTAHFVIARGVDDSGKLKNQTTSSGRPTTSSAPISYPPEDETRRATVGRDAAFDSVYAQIGVVDRPSDTSESSLSPGPKSVCLVDVFLHRRPTHGDEFADSIGVVANQFAEQLTLCEKGSGVARGRRCREPAREEADEVGVALVGHAALMGLLVRDGVRDLPPRHVAVVVCLSGPRKIEARQAQAAHQRRHEHRLRPTSLSVERRRETEIDSDSGERHFEGAVDRGDTLRARPVETIRQLIGFLDEASRGSVEFRSRRLDITGRRPRHSLLERTCTVVNTPQSVEQHGDDESRREKSRRGPSGEIRDRSLPTTPGQERPHEAADRRQHRARQSQLRDAERERPSDRRQARRDRGAETLRIDSFGEFLIASEAHEDEEESQRRRYDRQATGRDDALVLRGLAR